MVSHTDESHHVMHTPTQCTPAPHTMRALSTATALTSTNGFRRRLLVWIRSNFQICHCKKVRRSAHKPIAEGIRHKLSLEVERELNFDRHSMRPKKSSARPYWLPCNQRYSPKLWNREKYCWGDIQRRVRHSLGGAIYKPSLRHVEYHVMHALTWYTRPWVVDEIEVMRVLLPNRYWLVAYIDLM